MSADPHHDHPAEGPDVLIVGAGLAGLGCALGLTGTALTYRVLEASDEPGGRVRTEVVEGFRLDAGFQVFSTDYAAVRRWLGPLPLHRFAPGARVWRGGRFHRVADPLRRPDALAATLAAPIGTLGDKLRVAGLAWRARRAGFGAELEPGLATADWLRRLGFSGEMLEAFWRPFFGGILLDESLGLPARRAARAYSAFARGHAVLPAGGMAALARTLAERIPPGWLRLRAPVARVAPGAVTLADGEILEATHVVVATDAATAARLVPELRPPARWQGVRCWHFAVEGPPPSDGRWLVLNGEPADGPVLNLAWPSAVAPGYAPAGWQTCAATTLDPAADEGAVRAQLARWYGPAARGWRLLRCQDLPHALPGPAAAAPSGRLFQVLDSTGEHPRWIAGDWLGEPSIETAFASGWQVAQACVGADSDEHEHVH